jgi:hypothetical protein
MCRRTALGGGIVLAKCAMEVAQGRQNDASGQHDRLGETLIPGHNATPQFDRSSRSLDANTQFNGVGEFPRRNFHPDGSREKKSGGASSI